MAYNPVDPTDQTITNLVSDIYGRCCVNISIKGTNVSTENQYLLLFGLRGIFGEPTAQFFVGTDLVNTEVLSSRDEQVAILLDCPGSNVDVQVYVRLASAQWYGTIGIKGVDCFLL